MFLLYIFVYALNTVIQVHIGNEVCLYVLSSISCHVFVSLYFTTFHVLLCFYWVVLLKLYGYKIFKVVCDLLALAKNCFISLLWLTF